MFGGLSLILHLVSSSGLNNNKIKKIQQHYWISLVIESSRLQTVVIHNILAWGVNLLQYSFIVHRSPLFKKPLD